MQVVLTVERRVFSLTLMELGGRGEILVGAYKCGISSSTVYRPDRGHPRIVGGQHIGVVGLGASNAELAAGVVVELAHR